MAACINVAETYIAQIRFDESRNILLYGGRGAGLRPQEVPGDVRTCPWSDSINRNIGEISDNLELLENKIGKFPFAQPACPKMKGWYTINIDVFFSRNFVNLPKRLKCLGCIHADLQFQM